MSGARIDYLTPTGWAEENRAERLRLKQHQLMPVGPAGIEIPPSKAIYRSTIDGKLLRAIVGASYKAHVAREQTRADHAAAAQMMADDIARRFPGADMDVLARYGFAMETDEITVSIDEPDDHFAVRMTLMESVRLPKGSSSFSFTFDGAKTMATAAPTADRGLLSYFAKKSALRRAKAGFDAALGFPLHFKSRTGRWPRWAELEREYPLIGRWLDEQRKGIAWPTIF